MVQNNNHTKYIWPSFSWKILSGSHKSTFNDSYNFNEVYDMGILWQLITKSMRKWWIEEVKQIVGDCGPYATVTINEP